MRRIKRFLTLLTLVIMAGGVITDSALEAKRRGGKGRRVAAKRMHRTTSHHGSHHAGGGTPPQTKKKKKKKNQGQKPEERLKEKKAEIATRSGGVSLGHGGPGREGSQENAHGDGASGSRSHPTPQEIVENGKELGPGETGVGWGRRESYRTGPYSI